MCNVSLTFVSNFKLAKKKKKNHLYALHKKNLKSKKVLIWIDLRQVLVIFLGKM